MVELMLQQSLQVGEELRDEPHVHRRFLYPASEQFTAGLPVSSQCSSGDVSKGSNQQTCTV